MFFFEISLQFSLWNRQSCLHLPNQSDGVWFFLFAYKIVEISILYERACIIWESLQVKDSVVCVRSLSVRARLVYTPQRSQNVWSRLIKCRVACRSTWSEQSLRAPGPPGGLVRMQDLSIPIEFLFIYLLACLLLAIENYDTTTGIGVKVKILVL